MSDRRLAIIGLTVVGFLLLGMVPVIVWLRGGGEVDSAAVIGLLTVIVIKIAKLGGDNADE